MVVRVRWVNIAGISRRPSWPWWTSGPELRCLHASLASQSIVNHDPQCPWKRLSIWDRMCFLATHSNHCLSRTSRRNTTSLAFGVILTLEELVVWGFNFTIRSWTNNILKSMFIVCPLTGRVLFWDMSSWSILDPDVSPHNLFVLSVKNRSLRH